MFLLLTKVYMRVGIVLACGKHLNGSHDFTKREDLSHSPVLTTTTVIEVHIPTKGK